VSGIEAPRGFHRVACLEELGAPGLGVREQRLDPLGEAVGRGPITVAPASTSSFSRRSSRGVMVRTPLPLSTSA